MQLIGCGNPAVRFSTARLDHENSYVARAFSVSPNPEKAIFNFGQGRLARLIDLAGHPMKRSGTRRKRDGSLKLNLRPFEIVSFRVGGENNFAHRAKKD
jgi:hypothetical protein